MSYPFFPPMNRWAIFGCPWRDKDILSNSPAILPNTANSARLFILQPLIPQVPPMPISVDCPSCGKTLRAKDSAAGKSAKCPSCAELITIPAMEEVYDAEDVESPVADGEFGGGDSYDSPAIPDGRACPACGEMVKEQAKKCRHCGEVFDADLKRRSGRKKSSGSRRREGYPLADLGKRFLGAMADGLVGLLLFAPGFGFIIAANPDAPQPDETLMVLGGIAILVGFLVLVGLNLYLLAQRSQTIGKYLLKTQIIDYETDEPAGFVKAWLIRSFVNGLISVTAGCIPVIGTFYGLIDVLFIFGEERRCIHDHIAGTYVADIS